MRLSASAVLTALCLLPLPRLAAQRVTGTDSTNVAIPMMHAARLSSGSITLDGVLDEPAWQAAPEASDFMQSYPDAGGKPTDSTTVRVLYDNNALYVGVRMYDRQPAQIAAQLARRDAVGIYSDWLHLMIGTYHDRRTAFRFSVNPLGVKKDVLEYNDGQEDVNWDAIWQVATKVDSLGWTAEYRIPFSQMRLAGTEPVGGRVWDIQIMRDIARRNERDSWAPWTAQSPGFVSAFGEINDLSGIPAPERLEVVPYISARDTRAPGSSANPFFHSNDASFAIGGDIRYGLPNGLTLTGTVNPDFGQVEVDPAVVNLSAFETFFPEKRPFFLEGTDIFDFGTVQTHNDFGNANYFYSRRIGRQPQRFVNATFVDAPDHTTILGATKLTGKVNGWALGGLDAVTRRENADFIDNNGVRQTTPIEPLTNYFVGRVRHDKADGTTSIGAMATSTNRSMSDSALANQLRDGAYMGGLDFQHAWSNRTWIASGFASASRVTGTPHAIALTQLSSSRYYQRPDADYVDYDPNRTSLTGYTGEVALERTGAVLGSVALKEVSPGFEINDAGFQSSVDYRALSSLIGYNNQKPGKYVRSYSAIAYTNETWNFGNDLLYNAAALNMNATSNDLWNFGVGVTRSFHAFDERLTRGGPLMRSPASWQGNLSATTDSRWPVVGSLFLSGMHDESGASQLSTSLSFDARPTSYLHLNVGPSLSSVHSTDQYVRTVNDANAAATYGARYVFANLRQTTLSMDTRVDWTFTPTLTLQLYAQPFVSAGRYASLKQLQQPRTYDFAEYGKDAGTIIYANGAYTIDPDGAGSSAPFTVGDPNFNLRSLHGDAVLRWEYRPGSELFLVWQQERSGFDPSVSDFDFSRDAGAIFRAQPTNVFLVKLSYWLGR
jgi:hypothetical protein